MYTEAFTSELESKANVHHDRVCDVTQLTSCKCVTPKCSREYIPRDSSIVAPECRRLLKRCNMSCQSLKSETYSQLHKTSNWAEILKLLYVKMASGDPDVRSTIPETVILVNGANKIDQPLI